MRASRSWTSAPSPPLVRGTPPTSHRPARALQPGVEPAATKGERHPPSRQRPSPPRAASGALIERTPGGTLEASATAAWSSRGLQDAPAIATHRGDSDADSHEDPDGHRG